MKFKGDKADVTALVKYAKSLEAENDRLRKLLLDKNYIESLANYNKGHLSHANYLTEKERGLALAREQS